MYRSLATLSIFLFSFILAVGGGLHAAPPELSADEPIVFDGETGSLQARGNAVFTHDEYTIKADEISFYRDERRAEANGSVEVNRKGFRLVTDRLVYHLDTKRFEAGRFRAGMPPVFAEGERFEGTPDEIAFYATRIYYSEPGPYAPNIETERVVLRPGEGYEAQEVDIGVGDFSLFGLPAVDRDFDDPGIRFSGEVGFNDDLGGFFRTKTLLPVGGDFRLGANLDAYSKRGLLVGPAATFDFENSYTELHSELSTGWIQDQGDLDEMGFDVNGFRIEEERHFLEYRHQQAFGPRTRVTSKVSWWSDSEVTRDFRPDRFDVDQQPDTFVQGVYQWDDYYVTAFLRGNVNEDFATVERLPEIRLDMVSNELFDTGIYQSGAASMAMLRRDWWSLGNPPPLPPDLPLPTDPPPNFVPPPPPGYSDSSLTDKSPGLPRVLPVSSPNYYLLGTGEGLADLPGSALTDEGYRVNRLDAYYTLQRPVVLSEWLTFTPLASMRVTHYAQTIPRYIGGGYPEGSPEPEYSRVYEAHGDYTRWMAEVGADLRGTFTGNWAYENKTWGIDGLRHVFQPLVQWRYHPNGGDDRMWIAPLDTDTPLSVRPPLDLANIRAIDSMRDLNVVRFGIENLLQTRREEGYGARNLIAFNIYQDLDLTAAPNRNSSLGYEPYGMSDSDWAATYTELRLSPASFIDFEVQNRFATEDLEHEQTTLRLVLRSADKWEAAFGVHYWRDYYDQYTAALGYRFNTDWRGYVGFRWDADQSELIEQRYVLVQRIGNSWEIEYEISHTRNTRRGDGLSFSIGVNLVTF